MLGKGLPEDHPDRIAASGLAMQEAGRIDGMIAAMDWDPDEGTWSYLLVLLLVLRLLLERQ